MSSDNGTVIGINKLLDNGANDRRHNIVLIAEGFTDDEQTVFDDLCDDFVVFLQSESWFPELGQAINVFRLNVASDESGSDDPLECEDESEGAGTSVATYFDATFCNSGIRRCLSGDENLVRDTLDEQLPEWHTAAVLVNLDQHGGCARSGISWTAVTATWKNTVLHEIGHASFGLADEYNYWAGCSSDEEDRDNAPAGEPFNINITSETSRENIKWNYFIGSDAPVPTMINPDCTECDDVENPLSEDTTIGLYEGAGYYHCGRFRPAYTCRMRSSSQPFCRVCVDGIADALSAFLDGEPEITVTPDLLEFGDVAHGLTIYKSFEIRNTNSSVPFGIDIDLDDIEGDTSFHYAPDTVTSFHLPAPVFEGYTSKTIYVAFTSEDDDVPEAFGTLTVSSFHEETDLSVGIELTAKAVEPVPVDSVLVIDRSGSMDGETGNYGETKIDHALDAARLYVALLKDNDQIGIVRYNHLARNNEDILLGMRAATEAGKNLANSVLIADNLEPDGYTSIGGGIILGSSVLDGGTSDGRALVVLTDGIQNTSPDIPEATGIVQMKSPRQRVFAVGLGLNQLEDKINQIASVTNGVAQITGDLVDEKEFLLQKLYVQILSDISDEAFVKDPKQVVFPGKHKSTNIHLGEVDISADFIVVFRKNTLFPKYMQVFLETPNGNIFSANDIAALPNATVVTGSGYVYFRILFPLKPDEPSGHIGRWKVWVSNNTANTVTHFSAGIPLYCSVMCKARSNFLLGGRLEQLEHKPGSAMQVILEPTLYGQPVKLSTPVEVDVVHPNGYKQKLILEYQADGTYQTAYSDTAQVGSYLFTADVAARTPDKAHITRYRVMTGTIFIPTVTTGDSNDNEKIADEIRKCCKKILSKL